MKRILLLILACVSYCAVYAQPRTLRVVYEEELKYAKAYLQSTDAVLRNTHIALVDKKNENKATNSFRRLLLRLR